MEKFSGIKNILVIKLRHIGDVLLTVPVFRALRETFPEARISAIVNSGTEEVLSGNKLIDEVIIYDRGIKSMPFHARMLAELRFWKRVRSGKFDLAVDMTNGDRAAMLTLVSGARYRIAYTPDPGGMPCKKFLYTHLAKKDGTQHMVKQNLDVVQQFGISTRDLTVDFYIPQEAGDFADAIFKKHGIAEDDYVVHVHPTSRWLFKCWKDEHMADVMNWLVKNNIRVIFTSSPAAQETSRARNILAMLDNSSAVIDLCGETTLKQLGALSKRADLFIGVDSAPMHIAAAVGTPVIALFGPSGEAQWYPWGNGHKLFVRKLGCPYCAQCERDGVSVRRCLEAISPQEVIEEIRNRLAAAKKDKK